MTYMTYIGYLEFSQSLLLNNPTNQMKLVKVDERISRKSLLSVRYEWLSDYHMMYSVELFYLLQPAFFCTFFKSFFKIRELMGHPAGLTGSRHQCTPTEMLI